MTDDMSIPSGKEASASDDHRNAIIDAMLQLLEDRPLSEVTLPAIAAAANVSLGQIYASFSSRGAIVAAFVKRIDAAVLENGFSDMVDEAPRDRLFDVLMARLDQLRPHRGAIEALMLAARRDPAAAMGLNALSARSNTWMLAAANLSVDGWRGRIAIQALNMSFARVLKVFIKEEDPGLPRTMAKLDQELRQLEERHKSLSRIFGGALKNAGDRDARGSATTAPAEDPSGGDFDAPSGRAAESSGDVGAPTSTSPASEAPPADAGPEGENGGPSSSRDGPDDASSATARPDRPL